MDKYQQNCILLRDIGSRTADERYCPTDRNWGEKNEGFDAFIPLIDSGISLYVWSEKRFFASLLFTCKEFDSEDAVSYTRDFFRAEEIVHLATEKGLIKG